MNSKARMQRRHSSHRALERYGIELDHDAAIKKIHRGDGLHLQKQSNRVAIWLIEQDGKFLPVVFDKLRSTIASALPEAFLISLGAVKGAEIEAWKAKRIKS